MSCSDIVPKERTSVLAGSSLRIGSDVTPEFKKAVMEVADSDWQSIYREFDGHRVKTDQEWVEVCFIPNAIGHSKDAPVYR